MSPLPERISVYKVEQRLGQGGMATVYQARSPDGRQVAVKWLMESGPKLVERFAREVRCLQAISHPGVVHCFDHGVWEGRPYLVMEYIQGVDLRLYGNRLRRLPPSERHARARDIAISLCTSLSAIHAQGLIHRDVKPANVLVEAGGRVVLTDFGVAMVEGAEITAVGVLIGTATYAAPEQLAGGALDARVDQYGLGCTLYQLLTGHRPFEQEDIASLIRAHLDTDPRPPSQRDPTIPSDLDAFVMRLMSREASGRFRNLEEARQALTGPLPTEVPLAGRQDVVDALVAALDRVAAGETVRLFLEGPIGSGKRWTLSLARTAASRRGLQLLGPQDPVQGAALILAEAPFPGAAPLPLPPLSLADLRRSVHAFAPGTSDMARASERLHRETGGNPGLFVQLLRRYTEGDKLILPSGALEVDPTRWLQGLDFDDQMVAGALALLQAPTTPDILQDLTQVSTDEVLPRLSLHGIARRHGDRWALAAEALRGACQALLPDPEGMQAQILASAALSRGLPPEDPVLIEAKALAEKGQRVAAQALLAESGGSGDLRAGRLLALGSLDWKQGAVAQAWTHYAEALRYAEHPRYKARAYTGIGISAFQVGHIGAALDNFEQARTAAALSGDVEREAIALLNLSEVRCHAGNLASALQCARRAVVLCEGLKERSLACTAIRHLGQALLSVGLSAEAGRHLADASALAKALSLPEERLAAHVLRARASLEELPGDRTAAAAALDRLSPLLSGAPPAQDPEGFWLLLQCTRAWAAAVCGDKRTYQRAKSESDTGMAGQRLSVRLQAERLLAEAARTIGQPDEALRRAEQVIQEAQMRGFRLLAWEAGLLKSRLDGSLPPSSALLAEGLTDREQVALTRR